jgi:monovalent cation:H+ antiporter-2, CPA2 family
MTLGRLFGLKRLSLLEAAMLLGPGGEFAFVLLAAATTAGIFAAQDTDHVLLVVTLSMMAIPLLAKLAKRSRKALAPLAEPNALALEKPEQQSSHIIIAGFGRVGALVADVLRDQSMAYVGVDFDVNNVTQGRKSGHKVYFGDAANMAFLESCGLQDAKAIAVTMDAPSRTAEIVRLVRKHNPEIKIIARARDERHAHKLYEAGVTEAVPETTEASLQLAEALLVETGLPMGLAIAAIHERRDQSRKSLGRPDRREQVAQARNRLRNRLQT